MEPFTELMLKLKEVCLEHLQLDLNLAELPKDGGVYAELGTAAEKPYVRASVSTTKVPVLFMCKAFDEPECIEILSKLCTYVRKNRRMLSGETYQMRCLRVASTPHKTGRTEDGQTVYSCIIEFEICY